MFNIGKEVANKAAFILLALLSAQQILTCQGYDTSSSSSSSSGNITIYDVCETDYSVIEVKSIDIICDTPRTYYYGSYSVHRNSPYCDYGDVATITVTFDMGDIMIPSQVDEDDYVNNYNKYQQGYEEYVEGTTEGDEAGDDVYLNRRRRRHNEEVVEDDEIDDGSDGADGNSSDYNANYYYNDLSDFRNYLDAIYMNMTIYSESDGVDKVFSSGVKDFCRTIVGTNCKNLVSSYSYGSRASDNSGYYQFVFSADLRTPTKNVNASRGMAENFIPFVTISFSSKPDGSSNLGGVNIGADGCQPSPAFDDDILINYYYGDGGSLNSESNKGQKEGTTASEKMELWYKHWNIVLVTALFAFFWIAGWCFIAKEFGIKSNEVLDLTCTGSNIGSGKELVDEDDVMVQKEKSVLELGQVPNADIGQKTSSISDKKTNGNNNILYNWLSTTAIGQMMNMNKSGEAEKQKQQLPGVGVELGPSSLFHLSNKNGSIKRTGLPPLPKLKSTYTWPPVQKKNFLPRTVEPSTKHEPLTTTNAKNQKKAKKELGFSSLKYGPERIVTFYTEESLGIKLKRSRDGVVRVLEVDDLPTTKPGERPHRVGHVEVGDAIRQIAGVNLRKPISNKMWGNTAELIKSTPRPIIIIVAKELRNGKESSYNPPLTPSDGLRTYYDETPRDGNVNPENKHNTKKTKRGKFSFPVVFSAKDERSSHEKSNSNDDDNNSKTHSQDGNRTVRTA